MKKRAKEDPNMKVIIGFQTPQQIPQKLENEPSWARTAEEEEKNIIRDFIETTWFSLEKSSHKEEKKEPIKFNSTKSSSLGKLLRETKLQNIEFEDKDDIFQSTPLILPHEKKEEDSSYYSTSISSYEKNQLRVKIPSPSLPKQPTPVLSPVNTPEQLTDVSMEKSNNTNFLSINEINAPLARFDDEYKSSSSKVTEVRVFPSKATTPFSTSKSSPIPIPGAETIKNHTKAKSSNKLPIPINQQKKNDFSIELREEDSPKKPLPDVNLWYEEDQQERAPYSPYPVIYGESSREDSSEE